MAPPKQPKLQVGHTHIHDSRTAGQEREQVSPLWFALAVWWGLHGWWMWLLLLLLLRRLLLRCRPWL